jgi:glycosyltransferase involved in cell wall biosynthesis
MSKKIFYIHQYFVTPNDAGGTRSYWIAKSLINKGFHVTVITSSNKYSGEKEIDGIRIIYLKISYNQKFSLFKRFKSFLKFSFFSILTIYKYKRPNLIIATSTPLSIGIPALYFKLFHKVNYVFEVRDLWPDVPIAMGAIKNKFLIYLTKKFEKYIYINALHIVALSPEMKNGILKYVKNNKVTMIPNFSNNDLYFPRAKNISLYKKFNIIESSFKILYFGSMGIANDINVIIDCAILFKNDINFEFIFAGNGSEKTKAINKCTSLGIKNVKFLGNIPMIDLPELVNLCDISLVTFKDIPILYSNSPNKFFDSLAAGKPILLNSNGWTREIVENNNCGFYFNSNKPENLFNIINYLKNNPGLIDEMSNNSKNLALLNYDKNILTSIFSDIIYKSFFI